MEIYSFLQLAGGALIALFLPGLLICLSFFNELDWLEKAALSVALSISIDIGIAIFLGYNQAMKQMTGGLTAYNVWLYSLSVTGALFLVLILSLIIKWIRKKKAGQ
jgi:uncharacterized membrane protein